MSETPTTINILVPIMDERTYLITGYEYKAFPKEVGIAILRTTKEIEDRLLRRQSDAAYGISPTSVFRVDAFDAWVDGLAEREYGDDE